MGSGDCIRMVADSAPFRHAARCARTMPNKTVVHAFVEAFGRSAPRGCASRGPRPPAHAAARRQSQVTVPARQRVHPRPASLRSWRPCSCRARSRKEAVDVHVVLRLHARRGDRVGSGRLLLPRAGARDRRRWCSYIARRITPAAPWHQVCCGTPAARTRTEDCARQTRHVGT